MPAATAAAEPEDDPPGVCARLRGLRVRAGWKLANSVVTVLPGTIPPACRTSAGVVWRGSGNAKKAVRAATGQPIAKAVRQRATKSDAKRILLQVTTALAANTTMAVITTGKMNLALSSMTPRVPKNARCGP